MTLPVNPVATEVAAALGGGGVLATFGLVAMLLVVGLLVWRELLRLRDPALTDAPVLDAVLVPLLVTFAIAVAARLQELASP
jgi:hypothetical protein